MKSFSTSSSKRITKHFTFTGNHKYSFNQSQTRAVNMATAYNIQVPVTNTGLLKFNQQDASAKKASELLQMDLEKHHAFFNMEGFHNHIVHQVLSLFGTGAGPDAIQKAYKENEGYQRPAQVSHSDIADQLHDWEKAKQYMGKEKYYPDFLLFFQREIEKSGWEAVLQEHLFKGDERADDIFHRMFAGFVHPLIQLMYGVEWEQPAIVAEALAQAAVHDDRLKPFFDECEKRAIAATTPMPVIAELVEEVRRDEKLAHSVLMEDRNKIFDGVFTRAPEEMIRIASKVKVRPEELEERTAEMIHTAAWVAAGSALRPGKEPKWDFFLIHHLNAASIVLSFNSKPWISTESKVRMLEHKIRMDIVQYAARGSPEIRFDRVRSYTLRDKGKNKQLVSKPADLLPRFHVIPDDGHIIKVVRALSICQEVSARYDDKPWVQIKGDEEWLKLHYMVLDGTEHAKTKWVRTTGLDEAWQEVPAYD